MGRDTIADIITSIRNADMERKGTVRIASTHITENYTLFKNFHEKVLLKTLGNIGKATYI